MPRLKRVKRPALGGLVRPLAGEGRGGLGDSQSHRHYPVYVQILVL